MTESPLTFLRRCASIIGRKLDGLPIEWADTTAQDRGRVFIATHESGVELRQRPWLVDGHPLYVVAVPGEYGAIHEIWRAFLAQARAEREAERAARRVADLAYKAALEDARQAVAAMHPTSRLHLELASEGYGIGNIALAEAIEDQNERDEFDRLTALLAPSGWSFARGQNGGHLTRLSDGARVSCRGALRTKSREET